MFRVNKLKLTNWCQHVDREFDFSAGTNGLIGSNGRGKSNITSAIYMAVTGKPMQEPLDENVFYTADEAKIELSFSIDGLDGVVTRVVKAPWNDDGVREKTKTSASLKLGKEKAKRGTKVVTEEMCRLIGWSPAALAEHAFITQDSLTKLLFQQKAERMKAFVALIPVVSKAEPLRCTLQAELLRYPEIEMGVSLDSLRATIDTVSTELDGCKKRDGLLTAELAAIDYEDTLAGIRRRSDATDAQLTLTGLQTQRTELSTQEQTLTGDQALADTALTGAEAKLGPLDTQATEARSELSTLDKNQQMFDTYQSAQARLTALETSLAALVVPQPGADWSSLEVLVAARNDSNAELQNVRKVCDLLQGSTGPVKCPTCNNVFETPEVTLAEATAKRDTIAQSQAVVAAEVTRLESACRTYETAQATYTASHTQLSESLTAQKATVAGMPSVQSPSPERKATLEATVRTCEAAKTEVETLRQSANKLERDMLGVRSALDSLDSQMTACHDQINDAPTPERYTELVALKEAYEAKQGEHAEVRGTINAKSDELGRLQTQEAELAEAASKADGIRAYRNLLEGARDVLHRDKLPARALARYIGKFSHKVNGFLNMFGSPFIVEVGSDMSLECVMPSGVRHGAHRLSGGQRVMLSVSARFAIHELFSKDLGFLVLDEPSHHLDDDNVTLLAELMEKITAISKASNAQTVIVTHRVEELRGCFDNLIDLT